MRFGPTSVVKKLSKPPGCRSRFRCPEILRAMSEENIKSSRRMWDRFLAGDLPGTLAFFDENIEVHDIPDLPDASVYHGHQGYLDQIEKFGEAFSDITWEPLELIDRGDKVVSVVHATGLAKTGGLEAETTYAELYTWRRGKIVKIQYFTRKAEPSKPQGCRSRRSLALIGVRNQPRPFTLAARYCTCYVGGKRRHASEGHRNVQRLCRRSSQRRDGLSSVHRSRGPLRAPAGLAAGKLFQDSTA